MVGKTSMGVSETLVHERATSADSRGSGDRSKPIL